MSNLPPTHTISVLNKRTQAKGVIGAAWLNNTTGRISIKINPCVIIDGNSDEIQIMAFPTMRKTSTIDDEEQSETSAKLEEYNKYTKKGKTPF
jgi:hypothetical protein